MHNKFGKPHGHAIFATGPSNIAVDNLAERIERVTRKACDVHNRGMPLGRKDTRQSRPFVVRGYRAALENEALLRLLQDPTAIAEPDKEFGIAGRWKLPLSLAFWVLVCLDSRATRDIRTLHTDDHKALHDLHKKLQADSYKGLRDVATEAIS